MIIGASPKPDRYANKAQRLLKENGHTTVPINPIQEEILGDEVSKSPSDYQGDIDTVTLYVRPERLESILDNILSIKPKRIIFNPGTEDTQLQQRAREAGIEVIEACTLVLLNTGQY